MNKKTELYSDKQLLSIKEDNSRLAEHEILNKVTIFDHVPEVVQIELTSRCNAQCVMCSHYYEFNECGEDASDVAMERLYDVLPQCKLVLLNGYGEPFISKHFVECLKMLKKYQVKAIVTTNLSVLTEEMCDIIPSVFEEINVSCTGYDAITYEKVHKGLKFSTLKNNLTKLVNIAPNINISLSCVCMLETVSWASDIVEFAHECGVKKVRFGRLGVSEFIRNYEQDLTLYQNYAAYCFAEAEKIAVKYEIEIIYPENYKCDIDQNALEIEKQKASTIAFKYDEIYQNELRNEFLEYYACGEYGNKQPDLDHTPISCVGICDWVAKGLYIDTNGEMFPCCESKNVNYSGNWNGAEAQQLRKMFYAGTLPDFCKNCPFIINNELKLIKCERKDELYTYAKKVK